MTETLSALLERVEKAEGPDREIDADIWLALSPGATRTQTGYFHKATGRWCEIDETRDGTGRLIIMPAYTASVDAATALVERMLPGVKWSTGVYSSTAHAFLHLKSDGADDDVVYAHAPTPPLTILAALIRALIALSPTERDARALAGER